MEVVCWRDFTVFGFKITIFIQIKPWWTTSLHFRYIHILYTGGKTRDTPMKDVPLIDVPSRYISTQRLTVGPSHHTHYHTTTRVLIFHLQPYLSRHVCSKQILVQSSPALHQYNHHPADSATSVQQSPSWQCYISTTIALLIVPHQYKHLLRYTSTTITLLKVLH